MIFHTKQNEAALSQMVNSVKGNLDNLKKISWNIGYNIGVLRKTIAEVKGQIHDKQIVQSYKFCEAELEIKEVGQHIERVYRKKGICKVNTPDQLV